MTRFTVILAAWTVVAVMTSPADAGRFESFQRLASQPEDVPKTPLPLEPAPEPLASPRQSPAPQFGAPGSYTQVAPTPMAPVFQRVEYEDLDNIHPCGIPILVQVPDPCACACGHCNACCAPQLVNIEICVPPGPVRRVKVRHGGRRIEYDFGKYEVEIKVRDGYVKVDYDD